MMPRPDRPLPPRLVAEYTRKQTDELTDWVVHRSGCRGLVYIKCTAGENGAVSQQEQRRQILQ